jgi:tetrahedral aminopeptidase
MLDLKQHLKTMVETHAPTGYEGGLRTVLREAWQPYVDTFQQDGLGSLIGIKHATDPLTPPRRIMLAAHMDEIGLMVRDIVDGFVFVHRISGVDNRVLLAQPVLVHGRQTLPGVVATVPPHLLTPDSRRKYPALDELVIDLGLPAAEVEQLVRIGDLITNDAPMIELSGKRLASKAMDDRACIAAVTVCLEMLRGMSHRWEVYAAATVQEELGLYGAATAADLIRPDIAIALDVGFAPQPGVDPDDAKGMGDGPALGVGPNFHDKLNDKLRQTARKHEIKFQEEIIPAESGTDAWAIQVAREGIPTALFSIPLRNMHSPVETIDLRDVERAGRWLAHFIAALDESFMDELAWDELKSPS